MYSRGCQTPSAGRKSEYAASLLPSVGPKSGRKCYATLAFSGVPSAKRVDKNRIDCLTPAFSGARKWAKLLRNPCILGGGGGATPSAGTKSELAALRLPSLGPKSGRNGYATPALSVIPSAKRGDQIRIGCLTPAFSGAQKWAKLLRNPCIICHPYRQARGQNQNWLPHPCLLRGPTVGGMGTQALQSRGSPTPSTGRKSELATSPLPSPVPKCGRNWYATLAFLGIPNAKRGAKNRIGCLIPAFSRAQNWAELLCNPCILGGPRSPGQGIISKLAASPPPSLGHKSGQNCYATPAFYGVPDTNRGDKIRIGCLTPAFSGVPNAKRGGKKIIGCLTPVFSGAQKGAELLRNHCILGGPQRQGPKQNQNWLPHPCLFRGPKVGGIATQPLHSWGSPTPSAGTKSELAASPLHSRGFQTPSVGGKTELAASPLPSPGPKSGRDCYVTPALSGVRNTKRRNKFRIGCLSCGFFGVQKWAELLCNPCILRGPQRHSRGEYQNWLPHPCLLRGPKRVGIATQPLHSSRSPTPIAGTKTPLADSPLPSTGSKREWNCYATATFSGVPNAKRRHKIRIGSLTPAFSGAQKWAELLRNPCFIGGPQRQARGHNQNWLPHPCLLRGAKVGGIATQPVRSLGSPRPSAASKSECAASPLPFLGPKSGRNCYATPELSGVPNAKSGEKFRIGCLPSAFSGAQKWAELLRTPCILGYPYSQAQGQNQNWLPHPCHLRGPKVGGNAT